MAVLKEPILTVSTLGGCGGVDRTDFNSFSLWEGVGVLIVLDLSVSTLGRYGSLEKTYFKFLLWEGVAVLKKLNLTVSTLQGCGGLKRTGFNSFFFARMLWYLKTWI